jgi:serine/threonine protein kinase
MRTAIGIGSYGCVYRPPHKCAVQKPESWYKNKISKLMLERHSISELNEYNKIVKIDKKNTFFLGKPHMCKPDKQELLSSIDPNDCDLFDSTDIDDYRLLISKDGGIDLDDLFENGIINDYLDLFKSNKIAVNHFLLNVHNLLLGIKLFNDNDILHYDIKPSNIVFDYNKKSFKFIDFGLMDNISNVISNIKDEKQNTNIHWSYPLEHGFLKKNSYLGFNTLQTQADVNKASQFLQNVFSRKGWPNTKGFSASDKKDVEKIKDKFPGFNNTFHYMNNLVIPLTNADKIAMISTAVNSVYAYKDRYDELLEKSIRTIDTYALGFTINMIANELFKLSLLSRDHYLEINGFCRQLFDFNIEARLDNMDVILVKYEDVLQRIGVLDELNVRFENHKVVNGSINKSTKNTIKQTRKTAINKSLDISLDKKDMILCPPGKELNPITNRCVKICAHDKERNLKGRCVSKKKRAVKNKTVRASANGIAPTGVVITNPASIEALL